MRSLPKRKAVCGAAFLSLAAALMAVPAQAQEAPAPVQAVPDAPAQNAPDEADQPIIPDTPFAPVMVLDTSDKVWALSVSQDSRLTVNGDVFVNSRNRSALWTANSSIEVKNGQINVVGGVERLGRTAINPAPLTGAAPVEDPIPAFRVPPPPRVVSRDKKFVRAEEGGETGLLPGIYSGGIFATGSGTITLRPGVYVMNNGDFTAIGSHIEGKDVTIVMAGTQPGRFSASLGASLNLSAATTGQFKDVLLISRAKGWQQISISGGPARLSGLIYAPEAGVSVLQKADVTMDRIICLNLGVEAAARLQVKGISGAADDAKPAVDGTNAPPAEAATR